MTFRVREYQASDKDFILSLVERFTAFELPEWRTAQEIDSLNERTIRQALEQAAEGEATFVCEDEAGIPAGFIHLQTEVDYFNGSKNGYISDLATAPAFEGQGVGRLLMDAAEAWGRAQGFRLLTLYVFAGNARARAIYEKRGFREEVIKYAKKLDTGA
jgi:ribosomal protein S18 acetylase RimI-like enzyme